MKYIESNSTDPYFNLALEEYVFDRLPKDESYFMLWQNANTIVIGKYQNALEEVNQTVVAERGIKVARRLSGGGAVYHDMGNLNFTFIQNVEAGKKEIDFLRYLQPIVDALQSLGVPAEFSGRNDLVINGQKISGNAMTFFGNRVLEHGTLLFSSQMADVSAALKVDPDKFIDKAVKSVRSRVTNISDHLPKPMMVVEFKDYLMDYIMRQNQMTELQNLTDAEEAIIGKLVKDKYQTWEWNYGKSPEYSMNKKMRTKGGSVQVIADIQKGIIRDLQFFGDFFGEKDPQELADQLIGIRMDRQSVAEALAKTNINDYFHNVTNEEIVNLLTV